MYVHTVSYRLYVIFIHVLPGTIHIFQMDWKRYIIVLAKYLPSSLRPEVESVSCNYGAAWPTSVSPLVYLFIGRAWMLLDEQNVIFPTEQGIKLSVVLE